MSGVSLRGDKFTWSRVTPNRLPMGLAVSARLFVLVGIANPAGLKRHYLPCSPHIPDVNTCVAKAPGDISFSVRSLDFCKRGDYRRRSVEAHLSVGDIERRQMDPAGAERSEERRVGKECRSRWSPDH